GALPVPQARDGGWKAVGHNDFVRRHGDCESRYAWCICSFRVVWPPTCSPGDSRNLCGGNRSRGWGPVFRAVVWGRATATDRGPVIMLPPKLKVMVPVDTFEIRPRRPDLRNHFLRSSPHSPVRIASPLHFPCAGFLRRDAHPDGAPKADVSRGPHAPQGNPRG